MNSYASVSWVSWVLRRLPRPLIVALDGWSYGIAQRRAERRRRPATTPK